MWYGKEPLDQRHPAVEVVCRIRIVKLEMMGLFVNRRRVTVGQEKRVAPYSTRKSNELPRKIEPPAWITLSKVNHHGSRGEKPAESSRHRAGIIVRAYEQGKDDRDRYDQDRPKEGRDPIKLFGVIDLEARRLVVVVHRLNFLVRQMARLQSWLPAPRTGPMAKLRQETFRD